MLGTVQEAMSQVIDWWGDLPPEMKEAIEQFRIELGAAIDSVEFVKRALSRQVHETDPPALAGMVRGVHGSGAGRQGAAALSSAINGNPI